MPRYTQHPVHRSPTFITQSVNSSKDDKSSNVIKKHLLQLHNRLKVKTALKKNHIPISK